MKKTDIILLSLALGFFILGIYETMNWGISYSYLWFMLSIGLLFFYSFRRRQETEQGRKSGKKGR